MRLTKITLATERFSGASSGRAYASTSCTDGSIVRCLVGAKTAERSGESGEMIEPEEDP